MQDKETKLRSYLTEKVNPIFERLIVDLLIDTPDQIIDYSMEWLNDKGRRLARGEKVTRPKSSVKPNIQVSETPNYDFNNNDPEDQNNSDYKPPVDSDEDNAEDEDEVYNEEDFKKHSSKAQGQVMRISVSAEAYGKFNQKTDYKPKVIPKDAEAKKRIEKRLLEAFMFQALDDKERNIVIDAMMEVKFNDGDQVIKQGDDGDVLYLVDSGELDCYRRMKKTDEEDTYLKSYKPGEAFGELALLYNAPRAATIKSKGESVCFSLDRECFNHIVKEGSIKRRERYEETLKKVDILSSMDPYERTHLCDGLKELRVKDGDVVIKEGEEGDKFYMVDEGKFRAEKVLKEGEAPQKVMEYHEGDYFGELSLIRNIPRQATVIAEGEGVLVYLDFNTFKRLMGPMEDLLKRNEDKYAKYWKSDDLQDIEQKAFQK